MASLAQTPSYETGNREALPVEDARVLIVDDLASSRLLIASVLKSAGFSNLEYAADGIEAIEQIQTFAPDIVLLDIVMPRMDGFEVCEHVRSVLHNDVPILVQSGVQEGDQRVKAFEAGASDLVSKPINAGEMLSRMKLHLERRRMVEHLQRYRKRMEDELKIAEAMQISLLPDAEETRAITESRNVALETYYRACNQLGGDLWTVFALDEDRFGVLVVDLSGHGVTAAINAFRLHVLIEARKSDRENPAVWLSGLSADLYDMLPVEHFATGFYGVFDRRTGQLSYAAAGAPSPIVHRADGRLEILDGAGLIMGCTSEAVYAAHDLQLEPGDKLCLYSDALYEDFNNPELALDVEQIAEHVAAAAKSAAPGDFPETLIRRVYGHIPENLPDDLTIMMMERTG